MSISLATFTRNDSFYKPKRFLVTVKSFDMQAIRARYLKSRQSNTGRIGSVERREVAKGGLVYIEIYLGKIVKSDLLGYLPEPRGLDVSKNIIAVSSENVVHIYRKDKVESISNPWFSYIHTVKFNKDEEPNKILVSSSGYDCLFEFDLKTLEKTYDWFAWEHGFQKGFDPDTGKDILLTRSAEEAAFFRVTGKDHLYINDPQNQTLPTAKRAAFINSVLYDTMLDGKLLATLFHEGAVYRINLHGGDAEKLIGGMKSPHGGRNFKDQYMATSTATGEVFFSGSDSLSFQELPGKPQELAELEWLQNSAPFDDCIITIDANRNAFVLFDQDTKQYDMVAFDPDWAIQDIAEIKDKETAVLLDMIRESL